MQVVDIPFVAQRLMVFQTTDVPQLLVDMVSMSLLCCPCKFPVRSHPCRGAEAVSHGLAEHGNSPIARGQGVRRPCFAGGDSSTGAVVVKTVVLPQLHLP